MHTFCCFGNGAGEEAGANKGHSLLSIADAVPRRIPGQPFGRGVFQPGVRPRSLKTNQVSGGPPPAPA